LVLAGDVGVGKTHLAVGIIRARAEETPPQFGHFWQASELLSWLRKGMDLPPNSLASSYEERLDAAGKWPLLAIDDLGAHYDTAWAEATWQQIVDARWRDERETVVTLNVGMERFPDRLRSRLLDNRLGWHPVLRGPDYRERVEGDR